MPLNDGAQIAADRRRQFVASLLARNPRITRRQIQFALAQPVERGGIRNPETQEPYSLGTIQADVKAIRKEWQELRLRSMDRWVEHELVLYEELEIQAWRESDIAEVRRISEARRKMLGLDAPVKIAPTNPEGNQPFEAHVLHIYTEEEADRDTTPE